MTAATVPPAKTLSELNAEIRAQLAAIEPALHRHADRLANERRHDERGA